MILVWKFPDLITDAEGVQRPVNIAEVRMLRGSEGSTLNPIEDADGNWVVSDEEYCAPEFQFMKKDYGHIWAGMQRIEYNPKQKQVEI
jgi:hypothetical protein